MTWLVEFTDEFEEWWHSLSEAEQEDVYAVEQQLEAKGPIYPILSHPGLRRLATATCGNCGYSV
jgi:hypothetical protein